MRRWRIAALALAGLSCAEEPAVRPQWLVTLRTDAPLPSVADRLLVEIVDERGALACTACQRTFDAHADAWPLSFGLAEARGTRFVRARLFAARFVGPDGAPLADTTIDTRARLPDAPGEVTSTLGMRCLGVPSSEVSACDPRTGALGPIAPMERGRGSGDVTPGAFTIAAVTPCSEATPRDGEVCVEGGLFFLRDAPAAATERERARAQLIHVSSFFLGRTELTVGRFRALFRGGAVRGEPLTKALDGSARAACTYQGPDDASADDLPLNCVSFALAEQLCAAEGARLPTEAELAYAATNGSAGTPYPWGEDADVCARAVVARAPTALELTGAQGSTECRTASSPTKRYGPVPVTSADARADTTRGGVEGLAGNLSEWVRDDYAPLDSPCWRRPPVLVDPVCTSAPARRVNRGGSWLYPMYSAHSGFRAEVLTDGPASFVGLRCARVL